MLHLPMNAVAMLMVFMLVVSAGCAGESDGQQSEQTYADTMAEQHAGDEPVATGSAREPDVPVEGRTVSYGSVGGSAVEGYYAAPANADSVAEAMGLSSAAALPGLIVVHEWWGLNDNIRTMARRLAGQGYRALAVDLYGGEAAEQPEQARQLMQQATADQQQIRANVQEAFAYLNDEVGVSGTGVIGWCFGGGVALNSAIALGDSLDAAVIYYGHLVTEEAELEQIGAPVLGIFGADDSSIPVDEVRTFESTLREVSDEEVRVQVYEGAGHAFANPSGNRYVEEAAEDAWAITVDFLDRHLMSAGE